MGKNHSRFDKVVSFTSSLLITLLMFCFLALNLKAVVNRELIQNQKNQIMLQNHALRSAGLDIMLLQNELKNCNIESIINSLE